MALLSIKATLATIVTMKEITAKDAKNGFGRLLDVIQTTPVRVTRNGRPVGVVMSVRQFERLRGAAWEQLANTMDALGQEATAKGLTDAELESLLADES